MAVSSQWETVHRGAQPTEALVPAERTASPQDAQRKREHLLGTTVEPLAS